MKYIFCSFMFDDVEENVKNSRSPNSVSGHKFQENMLKGLLDNNCDVYVINTPRIRRYPDYKKIFFKRKDMYLGFSQGLDIGFVNLYGINYLSQVINTYTEINKIIKKSPSEKYVLIVYNTYLAQTIAVQMIKKKYPNVTLCNVIGDIYGKYGLSTGDSLHGRLLDRVHTWMDKMATHFDVYGFATKEMASALDVANKPFAVIEGMYNVNPVRGESSNNSSQKTIFYAGAILKEYGIEHLLKAFELIKDDSYRLIIAGGGDAVDVVKQYAKNDNRILYVGFIPPSEVESYQQSATVLVNPRINNQEYVKYSFASKNLECLASGIPYIAHDLPCNPIEYSHYIQYPENETDAALANKITQVCALEEEERVALGERGRSFIINYKNPKTQMKKIIDIIENIT